MPIGLICSQCGGRLTMTATPFGVAYQCPYQESHQLVAALDEHCPPTLRTGDPCDCHLTLGQRGLHELWCNVDRVSRG